MYLLVYLQLYLTLPLSFQLPLCLSTSLCDSNLVSFHPKLLSYPPLIPDIHVPSLTLISLAGNLFLLGKLVHCDAFGFHLIAVVCILFIFLYLISLRQCGRTGIIFLVLLAESSSIACM